MRVQLRRGTAAAWVADNPVLAQGEPGFETDTGLVKYGDGVTAWAGLPYGAQNGNPQPRNFGVAAWTADPVTVPTGQAGTAGTLYLAAMYVPAPVASGARTLAWGINTAGSGATAGQNFVGLYTAAGTLLGSVGVDARVTATGLFQDSLGTFALPAGLVWAAFLFNATGMPQIYRHDSLNASLLNLSTVSPLSTARYAVNGTGLIALPGSITPANNVTVGSVAYFASVS